MNLADVENDVKAAQDDTEVGPTRVRRTVTYDIYYKNETPENFLRLEDNYDGETLESLVTTEMTESRVFVQDVKTEEVEKDAVDPAPDHELDLFFNNLLDLLTGR